MYGRHPIVGIRIEVEIDQAIEPADPDFPDSNETRTGPPLEAIFFDSVDLQTQPNPAIRGRIECRECNDSAGIAARSIAKPHGPKRATLKAESAEKRNNLARRQRFHEDEP